MKHLERALDGQNQFWKYLVNTVGVLIFTNIIGAIPLMIVIGLKVAQSGGAITPNPANAMDLTVYGISQNLAFVLVMIPFALALITTILLLKPLHKRMFSEVVNGTKNVRWKRYFSAFAVWFAIAAIYLAIDYATNPGVYVFQFDATQFIVLLLLSLLLIPMQTAYEELAFRAYLAQGVAAWTKNRWLAILIPALLFGLMHAFNPEVKEYGFWVAMPQYIFFGLLFGFITIMDDGIELAMGAHAANNMFLCLFVTNQSSALQTPAVFLQTTLDPQKDTIILVIMGILFAIIFSRIYKWNFSVLNMKVEKNIVAESVENELE